MDWRRRGSLFAIKSRHSPVPGFSKVASSRPGQRCHPVIVAQAAATLAEMYPGRFWLALGTGQLLNEHVTGERWPQKTTRQKRLVECKEVMQALDNRCGGIKGNGRVGRLMG
jgi:alkanesulfonate monooxygenase SsuD/methylene tetrahydromethanopterin reductase-like flavin-dependent oxidoreductase (luciferase family)